MPADTPPAPSDSINGQRPVRWLTRQDDLPDPGELLEAFGRPAWHSRAACRGLDPGIFFPTTGDRGYLARRICATCPVRAECLDDALGVDSYEVLGIWGSTSTGERRALRRRREGRKREGSGAVLPGRCATGPA